MDGLNLAQDRDSWWDPVISVMHLPVPLTSRAPVSFSGRTLLHGVVLRGC